MTPDAERAVRLIVEATARVRNPYFALPVAYQNDAIHRERVYAYELYHQLRCGWPRRDEWRFVVTGELSKRGHELMRGDYVTNREPDLLVHVPGDMGGNLVIVEIKTSSASLDEVREDLCKIAGFCGLGYEIGVLLFFGPCRPNHVRDLCNNGLTRGVPGHHQDQLVVLWQPVEGESATLVSPHAAKQVVAGVGRSRRAEK